MNPADCLVCGGAMVPAFTKHFPDADLGIVEYHACPRCGFASAATIAALPDEPWARVNRSFHAAYQGSGHDVNDPSWRRRLARQAETLADLAEAGLIPRRLPWVDFGSGDGSLSRLLASRLPEPQLQGFEPHLPRPGDLDRGELRPGGFSLVVSTSVFEHLRTRSQLDEVAGLVADDGVMALHTVVAEVVPLDPKWFYYLPVHCSFFSNESMSRLFVQWGFQSSIYDVEARLWIWFKRDHPGVARLVGDLNGRSGRSATRYHHKSGFMDYWKLGPSEVLRRLGTDA